MKASQLLVQLVGNVIAINVQFKAHDGEGMGAVYTYLSTDTSIKAGDEVVVKSPSTGMTVVKVHGVRKQLDLDANIDYKFIVQKVDATEYDKRVATLEEAADKLAELQRKARIKEQMANLAASLGDEGASALNEILESIK